MWMVLYSPLQTTFMIVHAALLVKQAKENQVTLLNQKIPGLIINAFRLGMSLNVPEISSVGNIL